MPDSGPGDRSQLGTWCERWLNAPIAEVIFSAGHLSRVWGIRLADGRDVVVKSRPDAPRHHACASVQRALWGAGFPAPEPLAGPIVDAGTAVSAEAYVPGGALMPKTDAAQRFAELLARFVTLAPPAGEVGVLNPAPPWTTWDHRLVGVWPIADDRDEDLNAPEYATPWLDDVGARVRRRLGRFADSADGRRTVIGHGDWEAQNLRWNGDEPLVVHDWDSIIGAPEAVVVGLAASVWPCGAEQRAATVAESAEFLDAYQAASGRVWTADEVEASWAAGLWVYAYNTKKASLAGVPWLTEAEATERLTLAVA